MSYNGSYLLGSYTLRLYNLDTHAFSCQGVDTKFNPSPWTCETLEETMDKVFQKITTKLNCLVLINSMQLPVDLLQLAYTVATKFAYQVHMISGTIARLQWAVTEAKNRLETIFDAGEKTLIVYISREICEFDELVVNDPQVLLNSVEKCQKLRVEEILHKYVNSNEFKSIVVIFTKREGKENDELRASIESQYRYLRVCFLKENPEFMMSDGGLAKALTIFPGGTLAPICIKDFSNGFQIEYTNDNGKNYESLIPFNQNLPVDDTVTLSNFKSFCIKYNVEIIVIPAVKPLIARTYLKRASIHECKTGGSVKITASINTYGVPSLDIENIADPTVDKVEQIKFIIKLKDNLGSIWVKAGEEEYAIQNISQHEWTPFYISFLRPDFQIGEKGYSHWKKSPKHVVTDIHKVIGIPMEKIVHDKSWHFKIVSAGDDDNYGSYKIETHEGSKCFTAESIMSIFLNALKKLAVKQFEKDVDRLSIHLSNEDYKSEQIPGIERAALHAGIVLESIELMEI